MSIITGVDGLGPLQKKLAKYENPEKHFDDAIYDAVNGARDEMQKATPNPKKNNHKVFDTSTGFTRREWQKIKKVQDSVYQIDNTATSKDGKHAIVNLIRKGRDVVRPKNKPKLFIPINRQTADKARKNIYENIVYGKDYILADKAGPTEPNDFVTPVEEKLEKKMIANVKKQIKKDFS
jgi:hypothetical protein